MKAKSKKSLALKVPTTIIANESNYIINSAHDNFRMVNRISVENLDLDRRLYGLEFEM